MHSGWNLDTARRSARRTSVPVPEATFGLLRGVATPPVKTASRSLQMVWAGIGGLDGRHRGQCGELGPCDDCTANVRWLVEVVEVENCGLGVDVVVDRGDLAVETI
ncbi:hypothetical protein NDU88_002697 [Pleurodeles waltl]|uniref:Uncharacterized protein n=1 Tax=Pleurodeles waltl TaxID=8319 RepID=A0AAV7UB99_PLEWA|nr:hypothetical protein NDU88_002697 [Pleurodeles waltl]